MRISRIAIIGTVLVIGIFGILIWVFLAPKAAAPAASVQTQIVGELQVTLSLDVAEPGERTVGLAIQDAGGQPVDQCAAQLQFNMAEMDMGTVTAETQPAGPGRFTARGPFFTMVGRWTVQSTLTCPGRPVITTSFDIPIAAPGEAGGPLNPLTADAKTLQAGQLLYQANCATCHGLSGKGDGPAAAGLSPRPGDFSQHMMLGSHTDGQVYLWIENGYPGSAMPAWKQRLTEEQIWQLVVYLRTFAQAPTPVEAAGPTAPPAVPSPAASPAASPEVAPTDAVASSEEPLPPLIFARAGNLWRSDGGTGAPTQLTQLAEEQIAGHPALSPDKGQVAFIVNSPPPITATIPIPVSVLYLMEADGTNRRAIWAPAETLLLMPTWAPDGTALYVAANSVRGDTTGESEGSLLLQVVRIDLASAAHTPVLESALDPSISPDGSRIAYLGVGEDGRSMSLMVAAPDGSKPQTLLSETLFTALYAPRFSPDGSVIIFAGIGGPRTDEQGLPAAPESTSPLERLISLFEPPTAAAHGLPWDVWMIHTDGSGLRRLTQLNEDLPMSVFSPDGRQIAIMGAGGIYLMNADGSQLRRIDPTGDHGGLDWIGLP